MNNFYHICEKTLIVLQRTRIPKLFYHVKSQSTFSNFKYSHCYSQRICSSLYLRTISNQADTSLNPEEDSDTSDNETEVPKPSFKVNKGKIRDDSEQIEKRKAHAESKISQKLLQLSLESDWAPESHWQGDENHTSNDHSRDSRRKYRFSQMEDYIPNQVHRDANSKIQQVQRSNFGQKISSDKAFSRHNDRTGAKRNVSSQQILDLIKEHDSNSSNTVKADEHGSQEGGELKEDQTGDDGSDNDLEVPNESRSHIHPVRPSKSYNFAVYVNDSDSLSNLVKIGVDLSKIEQDPEIAGLIARLNWEDDIMPYINFLRDINVLNDNLGEVFTKNPAILKESLEDLQIRVNYFESKKFELDAVARIITDAPKVFSLTVKEIDAQLGYLQRQFKLSGDEVRFVIKRYPKLILKKQNFFEAVIMTLREELGFTDADQKELLLNWPKIFVSQVGLVSDAFEYVHGEMGLSHNDIIKWPSILTTRVHRIKDRHEFLDLINRAQYDPKKENFVSLKALVTGTDAEFCLNVAKVPMEQYNDFLKTL